MPLIKLNDKEIEVENGARLLQVALDEGVDIPHYCYHPSLSIAGNCRMCCVQVEGMPGLQISCNVIINELPEERKVDGSYDMVVNSESEEVKDARSRVLELLLLNHPLDCPVCDQAGECYLQDYSYLHGNAHSRFKEEKRVNPKKRLGDEIWIYPNRCVLCSRCVRFCDEIVGDPQLIVRNRGYSSIIDVRDGQPIDNKLSGNTADICPVGSLVSNDFLHKTRVWNLKEHDTVCMDCSVGCNVEIGVSNNEIQRIKPRYNKDVNDYWMCDDGRLGYHAAEKVERLQSPLLKGKNGFDPISWTEAFEVIRENVISKEGFNASEFALIGSPYCTNEENYLLRKIAETMSVPASNIGLYPAEMEGDPIIFKSGFRISPDKTPNRRGALDMLGLKSSGLAESLDEKIVYLLQGGVHDLMTESVSEILKKSEFLIVQSAYLSDEAKLADVVLPGRFHYEKNGTMTNDRNRVQRIRSVVEPPIGVKEDWEVIVEFGGALGVKNLNYESVDEITNEAAANVNGYEGISVESVGSLGSELKREKETFHEKVQ
ncbi:MAG: molybdopterin-dependent oxidoreductase [Candidatus Marinimicrobia bacterium]|nr:molybdopterin-dependent oxidoreductase [Candidatus Neomarinimicrobiota bacterium]